MTIAPLILTLDRAMKIAPMLQNLRQGIEQ